MIPVKIKVLQVEQELGEKDIATLKIQYSGEINLEDMANFIETSIDVYKALKKLEHKSKIAYKEITKAWNEQAEKDNQWDSIGDDEKIEFALSQTAATPDLYAALKSVEWNRFDFDEDESCCPACYGLKHFGHATTCRLAAALRKAEGK
jgi:hypothetical protein